MQSPKKYVHIDYLAKVTGKTQGVLIGDLINDLTHTIQHVALQRNPALKDDPDLRMHRPNGFIISTEEQQAWQAIPRMLSKIADEGVGNPD